MATGCRNYWNGELSKLLTEKLHGPWHLRFVNSAWKIWHGKCKEIMRATIVRGSLKSRDRAAAAWSARFVMRRITSTSYPAHVAIC